MEIHVCNANQAFVALAEELYKYGSESIPRGQKVKELNNVLVNIAFPEQNIVYEPLAKTSIKYMYREFIWYCLASQNKRGADWICNYAKFWDSLRDNDGSLNSNYGYYVFRDINDIIDYDKKIRNVDEILCSENHNISFLVNNEMLWCTQYDYVLDLLKKDMQSRQAIININSIWHKLLNTKDFPCTVYLQFFIRNNKLNMTANMRSSDLRLGFCNDVFQFTMFQIILWNDLKSCYPDLELGEFTLFAGSLHYYERHYKMMEDIWKKYNNGAYIENEELGFCGDPMLNFNIMDKIRLELYMNSKNRTRSELDNIKITEEQKAKLSWLLDKAEIDMED